jgi:hypothetical protein
MYVVMLVLDDPARLDAVVDAWAGAGIMRKGSEAAIRRSGNGMAL